MPLTGVFTWQENEGTVELTIPLKGVTRSTVDIVVTDVFVKVNYAPYLLLVDLKHAVDDQTSKAVFRNGALELILHKQSPGLWTELQVTGLGKAELRTRRAQAMESKAKRQQELRAKKKDARYQAEQLAMKKEWAIVDAEKKHIADLKEEEKTQAEADVYRTLAKVQAEMEAKERKRKGKSTKRAPAAEVSTSAGAGSGAGAGAPSDGDSGSSAPSSSTKPAKSAPRQGLSGPIFTEDDADESEGEEEDIHYVPPPRSSAKVTMKFTERIFPTPLRESKVAQEEDWIAKNKVALDKRRKQLNPDARDISERDPVWLKGKADDFYRSGDFQSAANAYSSAIAADGSVPSCYSNRAACYLALNGMDKCIEDCGTALEMLPAPEDVAAAVARPDATADQNRWFKLVFKILVRRGTAHARLGNYEEAKADYTLASNMNPKDAKVAEDVKRIEALYKCAGLKTLGDTAYRARRVDDAIKQYTAALTFDDAFVSVYSNRAACYLASNDLAGCVADCTRALQLMRCDHEQRRGEAAPDATLPPPSGPLPTKGTDRHTSWVVKTFVRRGVALSKMGKLEQARVDYERAVVLQPSNEDLLRDLGRIRARCRAAAEAAAPTTTADEGTAPPPPPSGLTAGVAAGGN